MEESKSGKKNTHDPKDYKIRWRVSLIPVAIFLMILFAGIFIPDLFNKVINSGVMFVMKDMGWFISLSTLFFVIFCFIVLLTPIGKIRLGGPKAKPDLNNFEYFALSLCAGMATGFILWPVAEMIEYSSNPSRVSGVAAGSYDAIVWAMENQFLHWAFTPYALYTAFGIVVSYSIYNLRKPYAASSALYPLMGEKLTDGKKSIIDSICLFSIIGGVAGSMGYGLLQLGSGLEFLFGIKTGLGSWILIAVVVTIIYTGTSVSGLKNGIAWLSEKNAYLFIFFLIFAVVFGPKSFMFNLTAEAFGKFINDYIPLLTVQDFMPSGDLWPQWWGTIWWLDWIAFAPMTGLFMASLSRGRTLKEFVGVNMILPSFFAVLWFGVFGSIGAHANYILGEDLVSVLSTHGHEYMQLYSLKYLPLDMITKPLMLITQMISFITLANSMTSTVSMMTITPGKNYKSEEAPMIIKIGWGIVMAAIAVLFLSSGGLDGAKSIKAITGFPIFIIELAVVIGFLRMFIKDRAPEKNLYKVSYEYTNLNEQTGMLEEVTFKED